ncbi:MAG TPA: alkaline phosphatase family protein [Stellaceae bacterium]|nr:alkaline phosphatase family protein [Stellaceae bacterium]
MAPAIAAINDQNTTTPIKHVIVIIGENHTFDNVFATYQPKAGQSVSNLLSKGIVNADGTPGPNYKLAEQSRVINPPAYATNYDTRVPYVATNYPPIMTDGAPSVASDTNGPPFKSVSIAQAVETSLDQSDMKLLTTGATGLKGASIDTRIPNAATPLTGPYQITGPKQPYDSYQSSPVHRFYQMWQQTDCSTHHATAANPSGCLSDLFPWVEATIGAGSNGTQRPANFTNQTTGEGSTAMGFFNVNQGDVPYFKSLADQYSMSDNFHQSIMGGTGANHIGFGFGLALYYSDGQGHMATPPQNEIENPEPVAGTDNWYTQDGYSGGSYSMCADDSQPGVKAVTSYLASLPWHPNRNCQPNAYYLLNNYNPGYLGDGTVNTAPFTIPPSAQKSIGDELTAKQVSWVYFGAGWNAYVKDPSSPLYCTICNPFQYETSIMTNASMRTAHIQDAVNLDAEIKNSTLPAVSIVKPDGLTDGHPASSKLDLFEAFTKRIVNEVKANPTLWKETAIIITFDEGGGYYDSGYIQPVDFFGDGTRIPAIVVSPFSMGGRISHSYTDHVSILKFIEKNWKLGPVSTVSRDNLPDPVATTANPYVPTNGPAIGDMMDLFDFSSSQGQQGQQGT